VIRDPKRDLAALYKAKPAAAFVDTRPVLCLAADGAGDPEGDAWAETVRALYAVSYGLRFAAKKRGEPVWSVMPLEALWFGDDPALLKEVEAVRSRGVAFSAQSRGTWKWTALIVQPHAVTQDHVEEQVAAARRKGAAGAQALRLQRLEQGQVAQILHVGPYATEPATVVMLHTFIAEHDMVAVGPHHEIYLSDPRRVAPEKLRTILRQAVEPAPAP
jgi:hypothetical protein